MTCVVVVCFVAWVYLYCVSEEQEDEEDKEKLFFFPPFGRKVLDTHVRSLSLAVGRPRTNWRLTTKTGGEQQNKKKKKIDGGFLIN